MAGCDATLDGSRLRLAKLWSHVLLDYSFPAHAMCLMNGGCSRFDYQILKSGAATVSSDLFVSHRDERVGSGGAAGGDNAAEKSDREEQKRHI